MSITYEILTEFISYLKTKYKSIVQELKIDLCVDDGMYIKLNLIKIKKSQRGKGYGSAIMYEITAFADSHNVRIKLWATNLYGANLKRLYAFYNKQGFVLIKNSNGNIGEMLYYPIK